jgi:hypothetical protein
MRIFKNRRRALLIGLLMLILSLKASANDEFYPLSQIKPGMIGKGYTVFSGTKIESFPIQVVGILKGQGSVSNLILIKINGDKPQGIASGMSGSPVFINKKLVGAIGYGFQNADPRYAMVTPIEEMIKLWDEPVAKGEKFSFYDGGLAGYRGIAFGNEPPGESWLWAQPVSTPLFISGFGPRAGNYLFSAFQNTCLASYVPERTETYLKNNTLFPLFLGLKSKRADAAKENLEPGSAIAVTLVDGDYQVSALGTLTWIKNGRFLGFGHSFLNKGKVEYGVGGAEIIEVIDSNLFPFKIGVALPRTGRVMQDRGAGIAGELHTLPRTVKVLAEVSDDSYQSTKQYEFTVIKDETLLPGLVLAGLIDTIDRTLDRIGPGTATVDFEIKGENIPLIRRENLFYGQDVAVSALKEVGQILQIVMENEFIDPDLTEVVVRVKVNPERLSAKLIKVDIPKKEFEPGEKVTLMGKVRPFRGDEIELPLEIEMPKEAGKWLIIVYGSDSGLLPEEDLEGTGEGDLTASYFDSFSGLEEILKLFLEQPQNNQLIAEVLPIEQMGEIGEDEFNQEEKTEEKSNYWRTTTPYYLTGEKQILVEVVDSVKNNNNGTKMLVVK